MPTKIAATLFSDPACPWGYSENPALRVIEWRYREQLDWELVLVGLRESASQYDGTFTPARMAQGQTMFRDRYGMPFALLPKARMSASSPACRAVIAARQLVPGSDWAVFRTLQLANFNTPLLFDDVEMMRAALSGVPGVDADQIVAQLDAPEVWAEYEANKERTRTAAGSPTDFQGKAGNSDGKVRYTAPSVIFETAEGHRLEAGGFQFAEAYDVLIANLDPTLDRAAPPESPLAALEFFELGLSTQEVAAIMTHGNDRPDRVGVERELVALVADGRAERHLLGDDAIWTVPGGPRPPAL